MAVVGAVRRAARYDEPMVMEPWRPGCGDANLRTFEYEIYT